MSYRSDCEVYRDISILRMMKLGYTCFIFTVLPCFYRVTFLPCFIIPWLLLFHFNDLQNNVDL